MKNIVMALLLLGLVSCSHITHLERDLQEETLQMDQEILSQSLLLETQGAVENLLVLQNPLRVYVGDSTGHIYLFSGPHWQDLELQARQQVSQGWVLGITQGKDGNIYCGASDFYWKEWIKQGGSVYRLSRDLSMVEPLYGLFGGINGMTSSPQGDIYFVGSNMSFLRPRGSLYSMQWQGDGYGEPQLILQDHRALNGLYWKDGLYCGGTFSGIFRLEQQILMPELAKAASVDAFDDFSIDGAGNFWMSDPISAGFKVYLSEEKLLLNVDVPGLGILSSMEMQNVQGEDILFLGEMRQPGSRDYDGRGVYVLPFEDHV